MQTAKPAQQMIDEHLAQPEFPVRAIAKIQYSSDADTPHLMRVLTVESEDLSDRIVLYLTWHKKPRLARLLSRYEVVYSTDSGTVALYHYGPVTR